MRILQIGKNDFRSAGGMENYIYTLSKGLVDRGHQVKCLYANSNSAKETGFFEGIEFEALPRFANLSSLAMSPISRQKISDWKPDLVHLHIPHPIGVQASKKLKVPRVITYHADVAFNKILSASYNKHLSFNLKPSDHIIFTSKNMQHTCSLRSKILSSEVIPIGVNALPKVDINLNKKFNFIFVGRLVPYKALLSFVKLLKQTTYTLAIVGDGPLKNKIQSLINELNMQEQVKLLGELRGERLSRALAMSEAFVLPSRTRAEAFGIVLVEAMQFKLPLLTFGINTGVTEVNEHQKNGLVVDLDKPDQMVQAMDRLMQDSQFRLKLGEYGERKFQRLYQTKGMVSAYESTYEKQIQDFGH